MLSGSVVAIPAGHIGCDTDSVITATTAVACCKAGFAFAIRYLARTVPQRFGDLRSEEAEAILGGGLGLMAVQHCDGQGWSPTAASGKDYGVAAVINAQEVGLPPGVSVWVDLEGPLPSSPAAEVIAFCNAWYAEVADAGYVPGIYVGFDEILTSDQLYHRLRMRHYWKSASTVPDVAYRGYQMIQTLVPSPVYGISIDRNVVMGDNFGGLPAMVVRR
jgi:Domain of unknown function (DUF1906)